MQRAQSKGRGGKNWNAITSRMQIFRRKTFYVRFDNRARTTGTRTRFAKMCHRFADFRRVPVNHVVRGKYTRPGGVKLARASNRVNDTHPTCNGKDRARCSSLIRRGNDQSAVCSFLAFPFLVQFQFTFVEQIQFFSFFFFSFFF